MEVYKYNPIFKDFLVKNDANYSFLENMKHKLVSKKWKNLTYEQKCYYLSNKLKYNENIVKIKYNKQIKIDEMIEKKKTNIEHLKEEIKKKEKFIKECQNRVNSENKSKFNVIV